MKVESAKILKAVVKHTGTMIKLNYALGSSVQTFVEDATVSSKLYGFNSSGKGAVVEVSVNDVIVDRIILRRRNEEDAFEPRHQYNINQMYHDRLRTIANPQFSTGY